MEEFKGFKAGGKGQYIKRKTHLKRLTQKRLDRSKGLVKKTPSRVDEFGFVLPDSISDSPGDASKSSSI